MNANQLKLLLSFLTLVLFSSAQAQVYKWVDANGQIHYSDKKPDNQPVNEIKLKTFKKNESDDATETVAQQTTPLASKTPYKKTQKITMYSASWCGYCKKARSYFKKNNIRYAEYDIEKNTNAKKRYQKLGGTGVPLLVAKKQTMQGFSQARFTRWYDSL